MSLLGGSLAFLNPVILWGLLLLPALWFLLRITPPQPKIIKFAPAFLMGNLATETPTTDKTPWWLLLLRLIILALCIIALAAPVLNPNEKWHGERPVLLILDNSWPSASQWGKQTLEAKRLATMAAQSGQDIYIATTANEPFQNTPLFNGPVAGKEQAIGIIDEMTPQPWPADYDSLGSFWNGKMQNDAHIKNLDVFWLSHGIREGKMETLFDSALLKNAKVTIVIPDKNDMPLYLKPATRNVDKADILLSGPQNLTMVQSANVLAQSQNGLVLDRVESTFSPSERSANISFEIPEGISGNIHSYRIAGNYGAGGRYILRAAGQKKHVGIVQNDTKSEISPLTSESYYIEQALESAAHIYLGTINELLSDDKNLGVIIMPDTGSLPTDLLNKLETWVKDGGLLLRFAGPNMTQGQNFLIPVPIEDRERSLGGGLSWDQEQKIAAFDKNSPFADIKLPEEGIIVRQQLLAKPVADIDRKSWAALEDGTPLITSDNLEKGRLVLIHTTATPTWSDFALSGSFVRVMQRIISMAGNSGTVTVNGSQFTPVMVLNGFGNLQQPSEHAGVINAPRFEDIKLSSETPPGIYTNGTEEFVMNIGDRVDRINMLENLPGSVTKATYQKQNQTELMPHLLAMAMLLFLVDWLIMIFMFGAFTRTPKLRRQYHVLKTALITMTCASFFTCAVAFAQNKDILYASEIHMAYIKSNDAVLNTTVERGLSVLSDTLRSRTSIEPAGIVGLNPETDTLSFFPFIYWAISENEPPLSDRAIQNIQSYMDYGGTILLDTRDRQSQGASGGGHREQNLRKLLGGLDIPPLKPIPDDHVLGKTFYLLDSFPGRYDGGTIWVEEQSASGRDGVSAIIIGSHDWASAWASFTPASAGSFDYFAPGTASQTELAQRFGINLFMYALTGNYKADQVHVPHILERLGQ